ncbi:hypothetical protein Pmani_016672 [Petrolisthes manimaculis]|uniref:Uncharacterized protein n=1 Tax=Petrolisthes manimaculis TaxID=1843537 RepID=A0AAE1PPK7_9EUCA|nr:hypothetical protein Pmani_016672 [Petrolisthes manimaculis]
MKKANVGSPRPTYCSPSLPIPPPPSQSEGRDIAARGRDRRVGKGGGNGAEDGRGEEARKGRCGRVRGKVVELGQEVRGKQTGSNVENPHSRVRHATLTPYLHITSSSSSSSSHSITSTSLSPPPSLTASPPHHIILSLSQHHLLIISYIPFTSSSHKHYTFPLISTPLLPLTSTTHPFTPVSPSLLLFLLLLLL